ncbi:MAG: hypothetical protein AMXMBFR64_45630 [Myxococcales bacterium]
MPQLNSLTQQQAAHGDDTSAVNRALQPFERIRYLESARDNARAPTSETLGAVDGAVTLTRTPLGPVMAEIAGARLDEHLAMPTAAGVPAELVGNAFPLDLEPGDQVVLSVNGAAAQSATFTATAAQSVAAEAPPYDLEPDDTLTLAVDGGAPQTATFTAGPAEVTSGAEPYALIPGDSLTVKVNDGAAQTVVFEGTQGLALSAPGPWDLTGGGTLTVAVDGGAPIEVNYVNGDFGDPAVATANEVAAKIVGAVDDVEVLVGSDDTIRVQSPTYGSGSAVAVAGTLAATIGWTPTAGTGSAADLAAASAVEVAARISAALEGASAADDAGAVTITTDRRGTSAAVEVTGGSANAALGFATDPETGTGNVADIDAVTAEEVVEICDGAYDATVVVDLHEGAPRFTTGHRGSDALLEFGGAAKAVLDPPDAEGTGNVADIDAVTAEEAKAVIEGLSGVEVDDGEAALTIRTTSGGTTSVLLSTSNARFGLPTAVAQGAGGGLDVQAGRFYINPAAPRVLHLHSGVDDGTAVRVKYAALPV